MGDGTPGWDDIFGQCPAEVAAIAEAAKILDGLPLDEEATAALMGRLKSVNLWRNQHAWEAVQRDARNALAGARAAGPWRCGLECRI